MGIGLRQLSQNSGILQPNHDFFKSRFLSNHKDFLEDHKTEDHTISIYIDHPEKLYML